MHAMTDDDDGLNENDGLDENDGFDEKEVKEDLSVSMLRRSRCAGPAPPF